MWTEDGIDSDSGVQFTTHTKIAHSLMITWFIKKCQVPQSSNKWQAEQIVRQLRMLTEGLLIMITILQFSS